MVMKSVTAPANEAPPAMDAALRDAPVLTW